MKNLYRIGMLAVAALAFASCNREADIAQAPKGTHVVTVTATKDFDTRTAIDEQADQAYFVWTEGDEEYFHIYENGIEATSVSMTLDADGLATFTASFDDTDATSFEYTAKYFKEESNKHNPLIVAEQEPSLTSYDPSADVLIAKPQTLQNAATQLQFSLRRVVSINKMTLKGLAEGEKISSVELSSTDKSFSAYFVAASTVVDEDGNVTEKPENYSAVGKKLTFDYSKLQTAVIGEDGTFAVYFVSAPVEEATFSVKVTTDQNVYERALTSKLTLTVGQVKRFGIQLGDYGTPISTGTVYTLVESTDDLCDGATYLVVGEKDGAYYALGQQTNNNRSGAVIPAPVSKTITVDNTYAPYPVKLTATGQNWYIIDNLSTSEKYGQYLYNASSKGSDGKWTSRVRSESTPDSNNYAEWTINIEDGVTSIDNVGLTDRGCLAMNYNNGNPLFNVYGSIGSYSPLALYVDLTTVSSKETPTIVFDNPTTTVNVGEYVTNVATIEPSTLSFAYSSEDTNIATVDETGKVKGVAAGTTTIKATFAGNEEYNSAIAFYEITVVDPNANDGSAEKPYTASEAATLALKGSTASVYVKGIISSIATAYSSTNNNISFWISEDGSADTFEIYRGAATSADQFQVGDYVVFHGNLTKFNTTPELAQGGTCYAQVKSPRFNPDGGSFTTESQSVTLTADDGATIYYSLDGSDPTNVYSSALSLTATTTVLAKTVMGDITTGVVSRTFTKSSSSSVTETLTVGTNGNTTWTNAVQTSSATVGNVTFTALGSGANDGKYYSSDNSWRFYTASTSGVKITVPSGKKITSVVITWKTGQPVTPSGFTASGTTSPTTYTANSETSVNEVSFVRNSANFLAQVIAVTYE